MKQSHSLLAFHLSPPISVNELLTSGLEQLFTRLPHAKCSLCSMYVTEGDTTVSYWVYGVWLQNPIALQKKSA